MAEAVERVYIERACTVEIAGTVRRIAFVLQCPRRAKIVAESPEERAAFDIHAARLVVVLLGDEHRRDVAQCSGDRQVVAEVARQGHRFLEVAVRRGEVAP